MGAGRKLQEVSTLSGASCDECELIFCEVHGAFCREVHVTDTVDVGAAGTVGVFAEILAVGCHG